MSTWITNYNPLHKIITYDNYEIIIKSSMLDNLDKLMETSRFLKIKWTRLAVADIRRIIPAKEDKNMQETMISFLSETQKNKVRELVKNRKLTNKHKKVTEWIMTNIIESIL